MKAETISVLIMIISFTGFNIFAYFLKNERKPERGFLNSYSDLFYILGKSWNWLFSASILILAICLGAFLETNGSFFIPLVFLLFLTFAPQYKRKMTGTIHVIGATGSILSGLVIVWILFGAWYWFLLVLVSALILSRVTIKPYWIRSEIFKDRWIVSFNQVKNYTLWIELIGAYVLFGALLIR